MDWLKIYFTVHAISRMAERKISKNEVESTLKSGEIIHSYPDDKPFPSHLILGTPSERAIHVVASKNEDEQIAIVVTVYEPDPIEWEAGFRRRKS